MNNEHAGPPGRRHHSILSIGGPPTGMLCNWLLSGGYRSPRTQSRAWPAILPLPDSSCNFKHLPSAAPQNEGLQTPLALKKDRPYATSGRPGHLWKRSTSNLITRTGRRFRPARIAACATLERAVPQAVAADPMTREDLEAGDRIIISAPVRPHVVRPRGQDSARAVVPGHHVWACLWPGSTTSVAPEYAQLQPAALIVKDGQSNASHSSSRLRSSNTRRRGRRSRHAFAAHHRTGIRPPAPFCTDRPSPCECEHVHTAARKNRPKSRGSSAALRTRQWEETVRRRSRSGARVTIRASRAVA